MGIQLEAFSRTLDFQAFRPDLEKTPAYSDGSKVRCPQFDPVLILKILVIQTLNNLSDERTEYLSDGHLSFMRFLGSLSSYSGFFRLALCPDFLCPTREIIGHKDGGGGGNEKIVIFEVIGELR